jgi:hypothetical protein
MEITGTVYQILDKESGKSARGEWFKQQFVIETKDEFPRKVCIMSWNNKVDLDQLSKGDEVKVSINLESREFNGKWYTDAKAWKLEVLGKTGATVEDSGISMGNPPQTSGFEEIPPEDPGDDLPF